VTAPRRRLYLDRSPGEARGVVLLGGRFERLLIERVGEPERARLGEIWRGRVRALPRGFRGAFIDLGLERDGLMKADGPSGRLSEGATVEAEVLAEGRDDKGPALRFRALGSGAPGRLTHIAPLDVRLRAMDSTAELVTGVAARDVADGAEDAALAKTHQVAPDLILTLDQARAMTAVDVDFIDPRGNRKTVLDANLKALGETARLCRLKSAGGLIVIDLIGAAREHPPLLAAAAKAFAADNPGVVIAGVSRLGVMEIAKPWRERPVSDALNDRDGRLSPRSVAQRLLRALEREGRADPGGRYLGVCAPDVATEAARFIGELGPRFSVQGEMGRDRLSADVRSA
jgi:Ribonuclease G/E